MTFADIITIIAQIAVVLTLIPTTYQLYLSRKIAKVTLERETKKDTIEFTHEVISKANESRRIVLNKFGSDTVNVSDERYTQDVKNSIMEYLNYVERLAVGINTEVYDYYILKRICGRKIVRAWKQYGNIVENIRKEKNHPKAYKDYEMLVHRLEKDYLDETADTAGKIENTL